MNVWNFVTEFYHVRIKYAYKICQHAVTKTFHLELVDALCSISKVSISLPWVKVMLKNPHVPSLNNCFFFLLMRKKTKKLALTELDSVKKKNYI